MLHGKPIVALDVDGTIAQYHDHFIRFAREWSGREIPLGYDGVGPFASWCGMSKATYRQCKLAYRQGGLKRSMPTYPHARELTVGLRKAGGAVIICTTRPYLHLSNVEPDTMHWLRRNGIQFDGVIIGEHKYRQLVKTVPDRKAIVMVVEDQQDQIQVAKRLGLFTVRAVRPHNAKEMGSVAGVWDLDDLDYIRSVGIDRIREFKTANRKFK